MRRGGGFTFAVCVSTTLGLTCEDLDCPPELSNCLISVLSSEQNATLAECVDDERAAAFGPRPTCESVEEEECSEFEICIDLQLAAAFCTIPNCAPTPGICPEGFKCLEDVLSPNFPFNSTCSRSGVVVSLRISCEEREELCEEGLACEEILFNGNVVGSFCSPFRPPAKSCDEVVCEDRDEDCVLDFISTSPENPIALCKNVLSFLTIVSTYSG